MVSTGCGRKKDPTSEETRDRDVRRRAGRGAAPDRVPDGARARGVAPDRGVPVRGRDDPAAGRRRGGRPGRGRHAHRAARHRPQHRLGHRRRRARHASPSGSRSSRRSTTGRWSRAVATLRAALRGDLHTHSTWSDGGSPIEEMAFTAIELGHDYLVLTDHSPRLRVANGLSAERLAKQLGVVDAVNDHLGGSFTLLKGIEVDILDDGSLDQTDEMLARLDVRVASVHSKLRMDADADDPPDGRRDPQPVHQRARPLHRPARHRQPRHPARAASSTRRRSSPRASSTTSPSRSTRVPSAATRRPGCSSWPATSAACSPSTATPTRPDSSTCSTTAAPAPRRPASSRTGSSTPGRASGCSPGRTR